MGAALASALVGGNMPKGSHALTDCSVAASPSNNTASQVDPSKNEENDESNSVPQTISSIASQQVLPIKVTRRGKEVAKLEKQRSEMNDEMARTKFYTSLHYAVMAACSIMYEKRNCCLSNAEL